MAWAEAKAPVTEKSKKGLIIEKLEKYCKDRTFLAVFEKPDISKHNAKIGCGYFDNNANEYIPGSVDIEDRYDLCGRVL